MQTDRLIVYPARPFFRYAREAGRKAIEWGRQHMSERQNTISTGTRDMFVVVQERLKELRKPQSIESLKQLFWKDLSYDRASEPLSYRNWPDAIKETLYENQPLLLFATGGKNEEFYIIYNHLSSNEVFLGHERPIVIKLLEK